MCSGIASDKMTLDINKEGKITQEIDEKGKSIRSGIVSKDITWEDDGEINQFTVESFMVINMQ